MRIRTTLFAVTLTTAALLGSAGTSVADPRPGPSTGIAPEVPGGLPMGGSSYGPARPGLLGADTSVGRGMPDGYPTSFVGRLIGL